MQKLISRSSWESIFAGLSIILLPLKSIYSNIFIILFIVTSILRYYHRFKKYSVPKEALLFCALFLIYFSSIFFTKNYYQEWKIVEKSLLFLFLPLLFPLIPPHKLKNYTSVIWHSIFILAFILSIVSIYKSYIIYSDLGSLPVNGAIVEEYTIIGRPYFGLIQTLSFAYVLSIILKRGFKIPFIYYLGLFLSIAITTFVVARMAMAIMAIMAVYSLTIFLYRKALLNVRSILFLLFFVGFCLAGVSSYDRFTDRFYNLLQGKGEPRILIWSCAYKQIVSENFSPILGNFSSSLTEQKLISCYQQESINNTYWKWVYDNGYTFNSHNEYLNLFLSYGLTGISTFLTLMTLLFVKSCKNKYYAGQLFLMAFFINCITENLLARQFSIFLFVLISCSIIYYEDPPRKIPIKGEIGAAAKTS